MKIALGVDTLTYHCRLEASEISVKEVFSEIGSLGAAYVQLDLHHVRNRSVSELEDLRDHADGLGLRVLTSGNFIGTPRAGDTPADGVGRIERWSLAARVFASPVIRVASSFYRAELAGDPAAVRAEQRFVVETLSLAFERLDLAGIKILLENHSDFTLDEYAEIIDEVGTDKMGVFLDLINPVAVLADPLRTVASLLPYAVAGHVKDYRFESQYVEDAYHRRGFSVLWCFPGEGVADLPALLSLLKGATDDRIYGLSIEGLDSHAGVADQLGRLDQSLALLRELIGDDLATAATW